MKTWNQSNFIRDPLHSIPIGITDSLSTRKNPCPVRLHVYRDLLETTKGQPAIPFDCQPRGLHTWVHKVTARPKLASLYICYTCLYVKCNTISWYRINHCCNLKLSWHATLTIASWTNHKQWLMIHISDLTMVIRWSTHILTIITRELSKLKTHSPIY